MVKILLIDHNDSFTYNIIDLLRQFNCISFKVISYKEIDKISICNFEKIILSPGPSVPSSYTETKELVKKYYKTKHFLGICLGHQLLSEFFGCKLHNLKQVKHGVLESIKIARDSQIYNNISKYINVGLYHSWVVSNKNFSDQLLITSLTKDNLIMSMEHKKYPIFGVQYHIESFLTEQGETIIKNFIEL